MTRIDLTKEQPLSINEKKLRQEKEGTDNLCINIPLIPLLSSRPPNVLITTPTGILHDKHANWSLTLPSFPSAILRPLQAPHTPPFMAKCSYQCRAYLPQQVLPSSFPSFAPANTTL